MLEVILDTSALIAFFVGSEKHHKAIRDYFSANPKTRWVIISTVFDETVTWIRVKVSIKDSITVGHLLRNEHRYIALSEIDDTCVWESFQRYNDKIYCDRKIAHIAKISKYRHLKYSKLQQAAHQMQILSI